MAHDAVLFKRLRAYSLTPNAALELATKFGAIDASLGDLDESVLTPAAAVEDLPDTETADAEEIAEKLNELLGALRAAGLVEEAEEEPE